MYKIDEATAFMSWVQAAMSRLSGMHLPVTLAWPHPRLTSTKGRRAAQINGSVTFGYFPDRIAVTLESRTPLVDML